MGPQGGPKDSIPPVEVRSIPVNGTVRFEGKKIDILFDEYIQLSNIGQNLLMSPPQQNPPDVKARGKHVQVIFKDSLRDSTTYTIDFGDAICDYTEKNPIHGYSFAFSTGDIIDTLELFGEVYDAENSNPLSGIYVGIHSNMADSAFMAQPFLRIAKTDSAGHFRIGNMRAGTYRLYAVDDVSRDYRLTLGEAMAYADEVIRVPNDSTLAAIAEPLFLFKPNLQRLYLQRTLRDNQHMIQLLFSSSPDSVPVLRALPPSAVDSTKSDSVWTDPTPYLYPYYSAKRDTLTLWLTDSIAIAQDTLYLEARYRRTDSLYQLEWYTDTLRAVYRAPRLTAKAKEAQARQNRNRRLEIKTNARKGFEVYDTLRLSCTTPLARIEKDSIHLLERVDTVFKPVSFTLLKGDSLPLQLQLVADLKAGGKYEVRIDSGALHDVYGVTHIAGKYELQVKRLEEYSTLRVRTTPYHPQARVQLLNNKDHVVLDMPAQEEGTLFEHLKPDTYYLRLYIDENGDGQWTTGSWAPNRQPEPVYYYSEKIQTKANWDFEEEWNYESAPRVGTKPAELIKASASKKK
ncbi:MAG: Ig-like domain-containing protein [Paludibacteraceae bacterium]|nr:Ig-like domain-containing protein [Paludibacteraceae bacterium]